MMKNQVWRITTKDQVPADKRLLGTTWVFKVKKNVIFKARLVAQGFAQIPGIDFMNNFSPVIYKLHSELSWYYGLRTIRKQK